MTTLTKAKHINFEKIIAGILMAGGLLWSAILLVFVGFLVNYSVSEFGYSFAGVVSLYLGMAYKWIVLTTILTLIWGIVLLVRYLKLCLSKHKVATRHLWVETVVVNALILSLLYFGLGTDIPFTVLLTCWTIFAILLAGLALLLRMRQAV